MEEADLHGTPARRLHPLTLVQRTLKSLPAMLVALLPLTLRGGDTSTYVMFGFLLVYGLFALPLIVLQYLRFRYWITPREIIIHSGVLTRRKRNIPIERIQNIVVERSLLPRLLGTAKVKIETAGSTTTEGVLEYVTVAEAEDIRRAVRAAQQQQAPAEAAAVVVPEEAEAPAPPPLFTMPLSRVMLSGVFRFSLIYIALIFSGLQYVLDVAGLSPEDIADWLMRGELGPYAEVAQASPWLFGVVTVVAASLLGWLTGIGINVTRYFGFRLWLEKDKLHRRHGLLTVSEGTIPLKKVQSIILRSNPLMRRFGWYRLELQTMGYDVQEQGFQVAAPFAQESDVLNIARHLRPFALPEAFLPVSRVTIRRAFVRYTMGLLLVVAPAAFFWKPALWGLLALPLLAYFALLQYRNHGYALTGDMLYIRRGVFRQYLWIVPVDRLQAFHFAGTYFQRRLGVRTLLIDTAGAASLTYPKIVDVEAATGGAFLQTLYARFQAHFGSAASGLAEPV